jgi:predicted TIM-barrel fold metal-dependent hydrolase
MTPAVVGARYRPAYEATLAAWQARWMGNDITHGVLVQPSFYGTDNSEMLAAIAKDPHSLRGVAVVDPGFDDAALRRLHAGGVRALRLNLRGVRDYSEFGQDAWTELFIRAEVLGWHLEVFVDSGRAPEIVAVLAETSLPIVFDHFGVPGDDERSVDATFAAVGKLAAKRPVWAKLSAPYRVLGADVHALALRWIDIVGPDRVVWGSDWPWTSHEDAGDYGRLRKALDHWVGAERVVAVLWDNAARLYDFAPSS